MLATLRGGGGLLLRGRSGFQYPSMCGKLVIPFQRERDGQMHDIVIRGGSIVDGTGAPARPGDVAIDGDRIVQVGGKAGPGRREVKADGRIVTPGWVDVHTHYDGQATWDPVLAPSSWHGATTIVFGNCGVGFAPVRRQHHQALIDLMEGVEDIPGITLTEGLKWDWESFPDYLDALSRGCRAPSTSPPSSPTTPCGSMSWASAPSPASMRRPRTSKPWPA
jgi:hypothetical protein